jgi:hypothetical protein
MYIIISTAYIELGEVLCTFESMDQVVNEWERVSIFSHNGVECLVVLDEVELTILLLDEEDWGN